MDINQAINMAGQMANHFKAFKEVENFLQEAAAIHADIGNRTTTRDGLATEISKLVDDKKQAEADRESAIQAHHDKLASLASSYAEAEQAHVKRVTELKEMYENARLANKERTDAMEAGLEAYAKDAEVRKQAIASEIEAAEATLKARQKALDDIDKRVKSFLATAASK